MAKDSDKKTLSKIKTKGWQRQLSMARAGTVAGVGAATKMMGSMWLSPQARQARNKEILSEQAQYLADELGKLKGSVVKVGQLMALYGEHILPEEVVDALRTLEEQTTALAWEAIEPQLRNALKDDYSHFDIELDPIGAASLAQVHRAIHLPSGDDVCLKIQYPGVSTSIDSDLNAVAQLLKMSHLVTAGQPFDEWLDEMRQLLAYEVDYFREAALTHKFSERLANHEIFHVPTIYDQYVSQTLIVSSYESGYAVNHPAVAELSQARRNRLAKAFLGLFIKELFEWGELQTDPNFGNYRVQIDENGDDRIVLLDFGAVLSYDDAFLMPVKDMLLGAYQSDYERIRRGAVALGIMQEDYPDAVHDDFAELCLLLVEPFVHQSRDTDPSQVNTKGEYRWHSSRLPKRAAKHAATSAMSKYFAVPPKEFAFLSRKLLGVYSFIAALDAEFNPDEMLDRFVD
ncbi:putative protein kinase UbiB [BD1-7 clade bacterium]|uniref:ABC1 atypical kinase-like domain-containing protein n=1 Tax=BD1-7 clade bacterium TaxID=2029982 RepID=A0A5S9PSY2_9GAMM|nr:putative protein kinase UbiB [BD1-7 clade bacterium]